MTRGFSLELAGEKLAFAGAPEVSAALRRRYGRFAGRGGLKFAVSAAAAAGAPYTPRVYAEGRELSIYRGDFRAAADLAGTGTLSIAPNAQALDAFLRSFLSFSLLRAGGFMLHSAGLVKGGRAYVFFGRSGAGKSTLSRLAAASDRAEVISDEINMVRCERGRFYAYGSPFWGEMRSEGRPGRWPLGGLFMLKKAGRHRFSPCGAAAALPALLRCVVNFERSEEAGRLVMDNAAALLAGVRTGAVEFSKDDDGFLELI